MLPGLQANITMEGRSPSLVVVGGDSCSQGCEFESQHHILDGHFSHLFFCKNCNVCFTR